MSTFLDRAATVALVGCALVIAGFTAKREMRSSRSDMTRGTVGGPPTVMADWERFFPLGQWIGDSSAKVKIVEFADFECPYCKRFHESFKVAQDSLGSDIALLLVQFPIGSHRFARPAALAAECATAQGHWATFHDSLFEKQDSLGLKSWQSFAYDAGISDTLLFASCVKQKTKSVQLDAAIAAGKSIGILGTPTVLINGMRYSQPPYDSLTEILRQRLRATP